MTLPATCDAVQQKFKNFTLFISHWEFFVELEGIHAVFLKSEINAILTFRYARQLLFSEKDAEYSKLVLESWSWHSHRNKFMYQLPFQPILLQSSVIIKFIQIKSSMPHLVIVVKKLKANEA